MDTYSHQKVIAASRSAKLRTPLNKRLTRVRIELGLVDVATLSSAERSTYNRLVASLDSEANRRAMTEAEAEPVWAMLCSLAGES